MPIRKTWPVFLVLITVLLMSFPVSAQAWELVSLPSDAYVHDGTQSGNATLLAASDQYIKVAPGDNVSLNMTYAVPGAGAPNPIHRDLVFLILSWTPNWPPSSEYYVMVLDQVPTARGLTRTQTVEFKAPKDAGRYYVWFCSGSAFDSTSVPDAVNRFTTTLPIPAHFIIDVDIASRVAFLAPDCDAGRLALDNLSARAVSDNLQAVGSTLYSVNTVSYTRAVAQLLGKKPGIIWTICTNEDKPRIEQELVDAKYTGAMRWEIGKYYALSNEGGIVLDKQPPIKRGGSVQITVQPTNSGWLPLASTSAEFKITKADGSSVLSLAKQGRSLAPGDSEDFPLSWTIPWQPGPNMYNIDVYITGYEGAGQSGQKVVYHDSSVLEVGGGMDLFSCQGKTATQEGPPSFVIPVIVVIAVLLIAVALAITRRKKPKLQKRRF